MIINIQKYKEWLSTHYANQRTRKQYIEGVKRYNRLLTEFSEEGINKYLGTYKNNPLNRAVLKSINDFLKLNYKIPIQKGSKRTRIYRFLEKEQVDYIINNTGEKTSLIVRLMFDCGLRLAEVINIDRNNIDLETQTVSGIGKRNKEFEEPFSNKTCYYLKQYLKEHSKQFPFHYKKIKHHDKKFWRLLKFQCEKIGMPGIHPHKIRHSLGHYLRANKGWDLEQIREKLRHEDIKTTQIYARATKEEVDRKIKQEVFEDEDTKNY